jgi:hypothetical protein
LNAKQRFSLHYCKKIKAALRFMVESRASNDPTIS